jgi:enoyl-CoA hydratase/carnithine racemase
MAVVGGVAWLRLERSEAGNRITYDVAQSICDATEQIELDDEIRVVVLSANGPSFCLGVESGGDWQQRTDWIAALARLTQPVIAAVQGDALAEGLELLLACDLRIAASEARFALPQLNQGRLPSHGATQRLPRIVGRTRAIDLLLTGRVISAPEAETMGLVSRVVTRPRLDLTVRQLAADLSTKGPLALRYAKEAVLKGGDMTLAQGIRLEEDLYVLLQTTADRREGVRAFQRKRRPTFRGR